MNKPPFDPNQPFVSAKPAFDPNAPFTSGEQPQDSKSQDQSSPGFLDTIGNAANKIGATMPAFAGAMNPGYGLAVDYLTRQAPQQSDKLGGAIAEKSGEMGLPHAVGAGLGMAASIASNPLTYTPIPEANFSLKNVSKPGVGARIGEMRTGVPAMDIERLRRDPGAFFSTASRDEAGAAIGQAKEASGVNLGVRHNDLSTLTPENLTLARSQSSVGKSATQSISEKLQAAIDAEPGSSIESTVKMSGITPDEASKALDLSNNRLSKLNPGTPAFQAETAIKSNLQKILEIVAPDVKEANKDFSRIALRDKFMEPFPVNQNGKFSKVSPFVMTPLGAGAGALAGGYEGAAIGAAAMQAVRSPFALGLQTAIRGLADKAVDPALKTLSGYAPTGSQLITNNNRRALLEEYIKRYGNKM